VDGRAGAAIALSISDSRLVNHGSLSAPAASFVYQRMGFGREAGVPISWASTGSRGHDLIQKVGRGLALRVHRLYTAIIVN